MAGVAPVVFTAKQPGILFPSMKKRTLPGIFTVTVTDSSAPLWIVPEKVGASIADDNV